MSMAVVRDSNNGRWRPFLKRGLYWNATNSVRKSHYIDTLENYCFVLHEGVLKAFRRKSNYGVNIVFFWNTSQLSS